MEADKETKDRAIAVLYKMGMDTHDIALELREDIAYVKRIAYSSKAVKEFTEPEDAEIATAMRNLAWRANGYANEIFKYGTPQEKFQLTKTIISRTTSMVGQQTTTRYDDMRNEFEEMMGRVLRGSDNVLDEPPIELESDDT